MVALVGGPTRDLAEYVRGLRGAAGLSQDDVAERAGLSVRTLRNIETGRIGRPQRATLNLLAAALGADPDQREHLIRLAAGESGTAAPPPAQLPPAHAGFVGRRSELDTATAVIRAGSPSGLRPVVVLVHGPAGIGKTALALQTAHIVADHFPDGALYVPLGGASQAPASPHQVLAGLCRALGTTADAVPADAMQRIGHYRTLLAGRRVLIVLDDAREAAQIEPLLPGTGGCGVLITSRWRLRLPSGGIDLPLDLMTDEEALAVLALGAGTRVADAPDAARAIVAACGGLPLALSITAGRLTLHPSWLLPDIAETLTGARNRLDHLRSADGSVRASFEATYRAVGDGPAGPASQRVFDRFAVHDGPFLALDALAAIAGLSTVEVEEILESLCRAHLVTSPAVGRYSMHDLLREYGRSHLGHAERRLVVGRLVTGYVDAAPGKDVHWFDAHRANILAVAASAATTVPPLAGELMSLLDNTGELFDKEHDEHGWRVVADATLRAGIATGRADVQAMAHSDLCAIERAEMRLEESERHGRRSLALFADAGVTGHLVSRAWNRLGITHTLQRRFADAATCYATSMRLRCEAGDLLGEAAVLTNLGHVLTAQGDLDAAEASFARAGGLYRKVNDSWGEALAHLNVADVHVARNRLRRALSANRRAYVLAERAGIRSTAHYALCGMADAARLAGHPRWAVDLYERCLAELANSADRRLRDAATEGLALARRAAISRRTEPDRTGGPLGRP
jgi:transcriptional regulator with XRE-family HTH domain/tetratricopeptide (TPR) repeat protein